MFAIDTNLLIYAHNEDSEFHRAACEFLERVMNQRDAAGAFEVCLPAQVITEFINVMTRQTIRTSLSLSQAVSVIQDYLDAGIPILFQKETQITTFLNLLKSVKTRKKVFDVALAATLKDHGISEFYTVNVSDFKEFTFLDARNPLEK